MLAPDRLIYSREQVLSVFECAMCISGRCWFGGGLHCFSVLFIMAPRGPKVNQKSLVVVVDLGLGVFDAVTDVTPAG